MMLSCAPAGGEDTFCKLVKGLRDETRSVRDTPLPKLSGNRGSDSQPRMKATLPRSQTKPSCAKAKASVIAISSVGAEGVA
tara:strand:+ start:302 stop:544 length:243 start_codon:yes stop_codon:yes gene_type:complete